MRPRSGLASRGRVVGALAGVTLALLASCMPYGFAGGGLPSHVRSVAVLPFTNDTPVPELQREVLEALRSELQSRLNLRGAAESKADAVVRGTIVRYEVDVPIGFSADPREANTARRRLQLTVDVQIVDQRDGKTLWERKGLTAQGEYAERAELVGRRQAIQELISDIIEGAQSQW
jgi:hypothetical protein